MRVTAKMIADLFEEKFGLKDGMEVYTVCTKGFYELKKWDSKSIFDWWVETYRVVEIYTDKGEAEKVIANAKKIKLENERKQLEMRLADIKEDLEDLRRSNEQQQ